MKRFIKKLKTLDKGMILRTILQVMVYVNQLLVLIGQSPFGASVGYQWITFSLTVVVTGTTYWYNNDWTNMAQLSGDIFKMLEDGKITSEELKEFIEKSKKKDNNL